MARISSARSGRPWRSRRRPAQRSASTWANRASGWRSWPYELTFWPSSVTSRYPPAARARASSDDVVEGAAALRSATERHDAVGAGLVAAVDDREPGADRGAAGHGPLPDGAGTGGGQAVGDPDDRAPDRRRGTDRLDASTCRRSPPGPTRAPADRSAPAPRRDAGTGRPPDTAGAARRGPARAQSSRSARPAARGSRP